MQFVDFMQIAIDILILFSGQLEKNIVSSTFFK